MSAWEHKADHMRRFLIYNKCAIHPRAFESKKNGGSSLLKKGGGGKTNRDLLLLHYLSEAQPLVVRVHSSSRTSRKKTMTIGNKVGGRNSPVRATYKVNSRIAREYL